MFGLEGIYLIYCRTACSMPFQTTRPPVNTAFPTITISRLLAGCAVKLWKGFSPSPKEA